MRVCTVLLGNTRGLLLVTAVPETGVLHQGRTGHSTGAVLSSLAPFPHSSARPLPQARHPVLCPFPKQRQPQPGAKCCRAAPPILPSLVLCHCPIDGRASQAEQRGGSACTKPSPTPQAGPCPSPANVQAWHSPVMGSPCSASSLFCQATGTLPWALGEPQTQSCGRELFPQTALRKNDAPVPVAIPAGLHVPGAAAQAAHGHGPMPQPGCAIAHLVFGVWLCFVSVWGLHLHLAVHRANGGGLGTQRTMSVQHRALPTPCSEIQPPAKHTKPPRA